MLPYSAHISRGGSFPVQEDMIIAMISPYRPRASAKMRMRIIPTNILGSTAFALTPASPTTPIAKPAAYK